MKQDVLPEEAQIRKQDHAEDGLGVCGGKRRQSGGLALSWGGAGPPTCSRDEDAG